MTREHVLFVAGLALFWPHLRGPYYSAFFAASGTVWAAFAFNGLALVLSLAMGLRSAAAARWLVRHGRLVAGSGIAASVFLAACSLSGAAVLGGAIGGSAGLTAVGTAAALLAAAPSLCLLSCAWALSGVRLARDEGAGTLLVCASVSYLASYAGEFVSFGNTLLAGVVFACYPAASAMIWQMMERGRTAGKASAEVAAATSGVHAPAPAAARSPGRCVCAGDVCGASRGDGLSDALAAHGVFGVSAPAFARLLALPVLVAAIALVSGALAGLYSTAPVDGRLPSAALALALVALAFAVRRRPRWRMVLWGLALTPVVMSALLVVMGEGDLRAVGMDALTLGRRTLWLLYWLLLVDSAARAPHGDAAAVWMSGVLFVPLYASTRLEIDGLRALDVAARMPVELLDVATACVALVVVACSFAVVGVAAARGDRQTVRCVPAPVSRDGADDVPAGGTDIANCADAACFRRAACAELARAFDLTERETAVLELLSMGYTVQSIAREQVVSPNTVRTHTKGLYRKLGIHSKQEAIELVNARMRKPRREPARQPG